MDGLRVMGKKTFAKRTMFFGFKEGGGIYRDFVFNLNEMLNEHGAENSGFKPKERLNNSSGCKD